MNLEFAKQRQDALFKSGLDLTQLDTSLVFDSANKIQAIMFVGEAPGANEVKEGRPFCGMAGRNLQSLISLAKIDRKDYYIANAFGFRPISKTNTNRAPSSKELEFGASWLEKEIETLKPKIIVALGDKAYNALCKITTIGQHFKNLQKNSFEKIDDNLFIARTLHPSPLVYNMPQKKAVLEGFFIELGRNIGKK